MVVPDDVETLTVAEQVRVTCWECDVPTNETVIVPLPFSSRWTTVVALCQACYQTTYLPLLTEQPQATTAAAPIETCPQQR